MSVLSLAHLSVLELTPPEVVSCAAAAGFDAVNLRLAPPREGEPQHPMIGDTPMLRETLRRLDDTGLKVFDVEVAWLQPATRAEAYLGLFETAQKLGAKRMIAAGADPDGARIADTFAAVCAAARPYGIGLSFEYMAWSQVKSLADALRILRHAGDPAAGVLVDALHADRAGTAIEDIAAIDPALLPYMQLCDAPAKAPPPDGLVYEARHDRLPPGEGGLALRALMRALPAGIAVSVEVPQAGEAGARPAVERARHLLAASRKMLDTLGARTPLP